MAQDPVGKAKALVAELCAGLYSQGHVSGTGGGISIKVDTPQGDRIVMAPSGVQVGMGGWGPGGDGGAAFVTAGCMPVLVVAVLLPRVSGQHANDMCCYEQLCSAIEPVVAARALPCAPVHRYNHSSPHPVPQKERMRAEDMFVLDAAGEVVHTPEARPPPYKAPKLSECAPLFMSVRALGAGMGLVLGLVLHGGIRIKQLQLVSGCSMTQDCTCMCCMPVLA